MREIRIADISLRESEQLSASGLSFKEKVEMAKQLEKLHVDVIETGAVTDSPADAVLIRTLAATVENSILSVPVTLDRAAIDRAWTALSKAGKARLNLIVPTSAVQMEYIYHVKPDSITRQLGETVAYCVSLCPDVEFTAEDATRSEPDFLASLIKTAVHAGAKTITLCDSAGEQLPEEIRTFIAGVIHAVPELSDITLSLDCRDGLGLASASALAAIPEGVSQIKVTCNGVPGHISIEQFLHILQIRGETLHIAHGINTTELQRICRKLEALTGMDRTGRTPFGRAVGTVETEEEAAKEELNADADLLTVRRRVESLGYDVSEDDIGQIYALFREVARKKRVDNRDIEALVAEAASQVAPTYQLENYVINSGNAITSTAFMRIVRQGEALQAISIGDGPIDAAFLAIEQAVGRRFELDDFQIQAVTEGREAMGDALVKLRSNGKLYSGRGLSTDIIGASIRAYLSAVNKIVYEEKSV